MDAEKEKIRIKRNNQFLLKKKGIKIDAYRLPLNATQIFLMYLNVILRLKEAVVPSLISSSTILREEIALQVSRRRGLVRQNKSFWAWRRPRNEMIQRKYVNKKISLMLQMLYSFPNNMYTNFGIISQKNKGVKTYWTQFTMVIIIVLSSGYSRFITCRKSDAPFIDFWAMRQYASIKFNKLNSKGSIITAENRQGNKPTCKIDMEHVKSLFSKN